MRTPAAVLLAVAAALCCVRATILPVKIFDDRMDNDISGGDPVPSDAFIDIIERPSDAQHMPGDITELTCVVVGHPTPRVYWLKNEMPYPQGDSESSETVTSSYATLAKLISKLQIIDISERKEDVYTCVAESALKTARASATVYNDIDSIPALYSSVPSLNRRLRSAPRKPLITLQAVQVLSDVGSTMVLPCRATGNPAPRISWRKMKNPEFSIAASNGRIQQLESGDLVFREANWSDMDGYICTAENKHGKDTVSSLLYPVILQSPQHQHKLN